MWSGVVFRCWMKVLMKLNIMLCKSGENKDCKSTGNRYLRVCIKCKTLNTHTNKQYSPDLIHKNSTLHCNWIINYTIVHLFHLFGDVCRCSKAWIGHPWPVIMFLSIRLCCWEITGEIGKSYDIPRITTAHLSQSNYFVYVCRRSPSSSLSLN